MAGDDLEQAILDAARAFCGVANEINDLRDEVARIREDMEAIKAVRRAATEDIVERASSAVAAQLLSAPIKSEDQGPPTKDVP